MALLSISLFGTPEFYLGSNPIQGIESDKVRALLAYLAVHADSPHRRDTLSALLWPEVGSEQARHNLRQALHNLRVALGGQAPEFLAADRQEVRLSLCQHGWLDVQRFSAFIQLAEQSSPEKRIDLLRRAVQLYRGEFLKGFSLAAAEPFEEWRMFKQEELHGEVMGALHQLAEHHERQALYDDARSYLLHQLEYEPWREDIHRSIMRLHWIDGQHAAALHQYEKCRSILHRELAIAPDAETDRMVALIRAHEGASLEEIQAAVSQTAFILC
jgi:DNA-binding SARP family transcriptional activator